jgi:hypothetical protein
MLLERRAVVTNETRKVAETMPMMTRTTKNKMLKTVKSAFLSSCHITDHLLDSVSLATIKQEYI